VLDYKTRCGAQRAAFDHFSILIGGKQATARPQQAGTHAPRGSTKMSLLGDPSCLRGTIGRRVCVGRRRAFVAALFDAALYGLLCFDLKATVSTRAAVWCQRGSVQRRACCWIVDDFRFYYRNDITCLTQGGVVYFFHVYVGNPTPPLHSSIHS
jgi:hypothetical protein